MEEFKAIPNFITYGISRDGRVIDFRSGKIKPSYLDGSGYLCLQLYNPNGTKTLRISRLVGLTYIPNPDNKPQIDHINRIRTDNRVENLRWADRPEQMENRIGWGRHKKYIYFQKGNTKKNPYSCWVLAMKNNKLKFKKRFKSGEYTLDEVIAFRNKLLEENDIPITD